MAAFNIGKPQLLYGPEQANSTFAFENEATNSEAFSTISATTKIDDVHLASSQPMSVATDCNFALFLPHIAMLRFGWLDAR